MLADAYPPTPLAATAPPTMLADYWQMPFPPTLHALTALPPMRAGAGPSTLLAPVALPTMLTPFLLLLLGCTVGAASKRPFERQRNDRRSGTIIAPKVLTLMARCCTRLLGCAIIALVI